SERIVIRRSDGQNFIFTSFLVDNMGAFSADIEVTGKLGGSIVESQTVPSLTVLTPVFGSGSGIMVDQVELSASSFEAVFVDDFTGQIPASTPDISINDVSLSENNTTASFTVSLSASSSSTVTVDYATANGTATS